MKTSAIQKARVRTVALNEAETLVEGVKALRDRLGPDGVAEFLRLVGAGRDRFDDIRKVYAGAIQRPLDRLLTVEEKGESACARYLVSELFGFHDLDLTRSPVSLSATRQIHLP